MTFLRLNSFLRHRREIEGELSWRASHDDLTGLPNRGFFEQELAVAMRDSPTRHALMFVDLDQFKLVNDTGGHAAGDALLRQVATTLPLHLRRGDLLARLGGDEFGLIIRDCSFEVANSIAKRLRAVVEEIEFFCDGQRHRVSASIGVVYLDGLDLNLEKALRAADISCYMAKEKGRNRVQLHQPSDTELLRRVGEMGWVQKIRDALEEDHFCLYAQEIVALKDDGDDGLAVEVLLRLNDRNGQTIPPASFMPAAERYDLMPLIDRWVLRNAFSMLARRRREGRGEAIASCAINLSGPTFGDPKFADYVRDQLRIHAIAPHSICFELTETSAAGDLESARRFIAALKDVGCRFALDDFGAGASSFGYLKHLPVDYVKIDGSFVKDMLKDPVDRAMVEMINRIGKVMGMQTIAEFAEDDAVVDALAAIGVDYAQGYALGTPVPFELMVGRRNRPSSAVA
jgi:diguanylate cyclase (GGDEF)-like protein